jgi:hypothetical protein
LRKSCGSNHPPKADGSGAGHPLISYFRRVVVRLARTRRQSGAAHLEGEGVTDITGRGQAAQAAESKWDLGRENPVRYLDPRFTVLAFAAGLVSFVGWGMWTGWTWGMETVRSGRPR